MLKLESKSGYIIMKNAFLTDTYPMGPTNKFIRNKFCGILGWDS